MRRHSRGYGTVILSLFVGLMFLVLPLPHVVAPYRPLLILILVLHWALYSPDRVGVVTAWIVGLLTDFLYGIMLGPYAIGFAVSAYLMLRFNARFNMFPLFQQILYVGLMVAMVQLFVSALGVWLAHIEMPWIILATVPTSMLCWPLVTILLSD